jgi:hypothetical protein
MSLGRIDYWETERYLAVVYPFIVILLIREVTRIGRFPEIKRAQIFLPVAAVLWLMYLLVRTTMNVVFWHQSQCLPVN